jgi:hypothetical protein
MDDVGLKLVDKAAQFPNRDWIREWRLVALARTVSEPRKECADLLEAMDSDTRVILLRWQARLPHSCDRDLIAPL